ncbi:bis(5'-nucleosyl)-tetraphosphatase (symmetrical) YqeK [Enterococcus sp. DIV1298c]|nr:bis(5'-nucleosyl)-tetraphosphatase (symmetrical) YqeK [Enterococcus sp. DIV1298c]MBO0462662.1 bis(5'-nucleosyl)-tetraphosphatase (symmetrical) YqeK [Enterococcus sp. DIV1298c]
MVNSLALKDDVYRFLEGYDHIETYKHCIAVGDCAEKLAVNYNINSEKAKIAGYLHDVSAIYPNDRRITIAKEMGIELNQEELIFPMIIHQKISKRMAEKIFKITDNEILSAIECHTTLKGKYSQLDLVVFVADKISWDQKGIPPYLDGLMLALEDSLESAALYYIEYILDQGVKVVHPWLKEAHETLSKKVSKVEDWSQRSTMCRKWSDTLA